MGLIGNFFSRLAGAGSGPQAQAATVPGAATGTVYTVSRLLGSSSTLSLIAGTNGNLTLSGAAIQATAALGGASQQAMVREASGLLAIEYPVTLTGDGTSPPPATGGTSATRYSFAATRFRVPTNTRQISGSNTYLVQQFVFASPDYAVSNPRFFMPTFWQGANGGSSPETANANTIQVEGLSIKVGSTWYTVPATNLPANMDPAAVAGVLLDAIPVTIPANTIVTGRVAYNVPASGYLPTTPRNAAFGEASQGSTSSLAAKLTDGTALGGTGSHADSYQPLYMVAQGGDGRPAMLVIGDSIGYGANDSTDFNVSVNNWSARGAFGYIQRGLDDNTSTKRIAHANIAIPGSRPLDITSRTDTFTRKKLDAIKAAYTATGDWPFDEIISQHGTNSVSGGTTSAALIAGMQTYLSVIRSDSGKPVTQVELLAKAASTDGYATLANQTASAQDSYNGGVLGSSNPRWSLNAAIGTNGQPDASATLRAGGYIQDSFAPWLYGSYDTGSNRDRLSLRPFATTLAAAAVQNATSFSMTAAPSVGECINIQTATGFADGHVLAVTGSGPYTVTMVMLSQVPSGGAAAGAAVHAELHAQDGTHPGTPGHRDVYAQAVTAWKARRGWA